MQHKMYVLTAYGAHKWRFCWAFDSLAEARKKGMQYVREGAGRLVEISLENRQIWSRGVTKK